MPFRKKPLGRRVSPAYPKMYGPLSPQQELPQLQQAKAGRRGDPLSLLREGSSLLPPPSYSMRQYRAPPPWQLAGTGGYRPPPDGSEQATAPAKAPGAAQGQQDAAGGASYESPADSYRRVLDQQIREKELRRSYEKQRELLEQRNEVNELPSYMNSHRGGGGDAPRSGGDGDHASPGRNSGNGLGRADPNARSPGHEYGPGGRPALEVAVPPPGVLGPHHGRRSQGNWGADATPSDYGGDNFAAGGPSGVHALDSIEEERSVEQKLYQPSSPKHARYRLAHADPEAQAEMLRKEEERRTMREVLAAQIAEKAERRRMSQQRDQQWDQEEFQRERMQNMAYARAQGQAVDQEQPPQDRHDRARLNTGQNEQRQQQQQPPGQHWQHASQQQVQAFGNEDSSRWQAAPLGLYPHGAENANHQPVGSGASSVASAQSYQPHSARYGAGGAEYQPLNLAFASGSDASSALNMQQYGSGAGGGAFSLSGWDAAGVSEIFGSAASRDSLDELKRLCKDLLNEQQGLRAQLVNQSNAVNELRSAAAGRAGGGYRSSMRRHSGAATRGGMPTAARLQYHQNVPPATGNSSYSVRSAGPAMGRRSSGRLRSGQQHLGSGYTHVPGPPNTATSIRSGGGSDRRHHEISRRQHPGTGPPPPGTGGSGSARQHSGLSSMPSDGKSVHDGEGGFIARPGNIEMPWGLVPEPAPMPKSPPIPTHRNRKPGAAGSTDKGDPDPPKPRASRPNPEPPKPSPSAGSGIDSGENVTASPEPASEAPEQAAT